MALAVSYFLPELMAGIRSWTSTREGLQEFLNCLSDAEFERHYHAPGLVSDVTARTLGLSILAKITGARDIDPNTVQRAAALTRISTSDLDRILPYLTVLLMGALKLRSEKPLRRVLSDIRGNQHYGNAVADPFDELATIVMHPEAPVQLSPARRLLGALFQRRISRDPDEEERLAG